MLPPAAPRRPHRLEAHGDVRIDDYYWLQNRDDPDVHAYLTSENEYVEKCLRHSHELQDALFEEIKGRIKQTDTSVPYREGTHSYYWRSEDGKEYRIYCRTQVDREAEQIMLDVNRVAENQEYCDVGSLVVSPDERLLGYAVDTVGRRLYDIHFRDLQADRTLDDVIPKVTGNFVWANDNRTLFYTRQHETTLRSYQIYRHRLGQDVSTDELVYEETDETFGCGVGKSRSKRYILIGTYHTLTTEYYVLDTDQPDRPPQLFLRREPGHEYHLDHFEGRFFIRSNADARNFRLLETDDDPRQWPREHWRDLVPHRDDVLIETFELFRDYLVLQERAAGLVRLRIRPWEGGMPHDVEFSEPSYEAYIDAHNRIPDTPILRFGYRSLCTPASDYDYNMVTRERTLLKREEVLGGFDSADYRTERLYATATDGTRVPISLVSRIDAPLDGSAPLLLYGYGSYGISMNADFRSPRFQPARSGFRLRDCPRSRRPGAGAAVVRRWQAAEEAEHIHRFHCLRRAPGQGTVHIAVEVVRDGRERRRVADGGRVQHAPRPLPRHDCTRPVRRCAHHDVGREHSADDRRVRRVGRPERPRVLQLHQGVLAIRQCHSGVLSASARHDRSSRLAGPVLGAREVGRLTPSGQDR